MKHPLELTVMMYHYVRDFGDEAEAGSGIPGMSAKAFEAQLDELSKQHIFVTWPQVRMAVQERRPLPGSACLLTFDDGVRDHYLNVFPILRARKISGLFFVLDRSEQHGFVLGHKIHFLLAKLGFTRFREAIWQKMNPAQRERFVRAEKHYQHKYPPISSDKRTNLLKAVLQRDLSADMEPLLSELFEEYLGSEKQAACSYYLRKDQMHEMSARGMHFGGHSRSHPWFDWIDAGRRAAEIKASAEWIGQFEPEPWAFAYPYGGLSEDSPGLLEKHGFTAAFTTQPQLRHTNAYFIGRLDAEEMVQDGSLYG